MRVEAILWDGNNKIQGELILGVDSLSFALSDFANTDLAFELPYHEILEISIHHIYGLSELGIQVNSNNNRQNIFIVAEPKMVRDTILGLIDESHSYQNTKS